MKPSADDMLRSELQKKPSESLTSTFERELVDEKSIVNN